MPKKVITTFTVQAISTEEQADEIQKGLEEVVKGYNGSVDMDDQETEGEDED